MGLKYLDNDRSFILTLELPNGDAKQLPDWPKKEEDAEYPSAENCDEYLDFFNVWGTYAFRSCTFGGRYQMKSERHDSSQQTKKDIESHVKAEYDAKYKTYEKARKREVHVRGGDMSKANDLAGTSNDPKKFPAWCQSIADSTVNDAVSYGAKSIGDMVNDTAVECRERKKSVFDLNRSLSFFNSFHIIQGTVWAFPERKPTELDIYFTGPPGLEVSYPPNLDTPGGKAHKKKPATHWQIVVPSAENKLDPNQGALYSALCSSATG
ncbi:hypothetical protein BDW69DRAFT_184187 [Aspergillus filifer]